MTLDQLRILVAAAEGGSLGAAAKSLNKTQPTLSVGLKNLEEELEIILFDRSGYRMKLTQAGEQILNSARRTLSEVEQIEVQAAGYASGLESQISIGLDYLCPLQVLLSLLKRFQSSFADTRLDLKFGVLSQTEEWLQSGVVDLALTPFLTQRSSYQMSLLCNLRILPVVYNELTETAEMTESRFLQIPQIVVKTPESSTGDAPFSGLSAVPKWWVSDHMIKKELILSGFGWGHLELTSIENQLRSRSLLEIENKYVRSSSLPLHLARRPSGKRGIIANELWAFMQDEFSYEDSDYNP